MISNVTKITEPLTSSQISLSVSAFIAQRGNCNLILMNDRPDILLLHLAAYAPVLLHDQYYDPAPSRTSRIGISGCASSDANSIFHRFIQINKTIRPHK
jgi:hypothetical protein